MWPFRGTKHEIISVSLTPEQITCSWFAENNKNKNFALHAYQQYKFTHLEFEQSIIFNPTRISRLVSEFVKNNRIKNPYIALSITGPNVFEKIVTLSTSSPQKIDFKIPEFESLKWQYSYLGPSLQKGFDFYICGMKRELIFQYKLLMIISRLPLLVISTKQIAQIKLYKYLQGNNFRQSMLAIDLSENQYNFQDLLIKNLEKIVDSKVAIDLSK